MCCSSSDRRRAAPLALAALLLAAAGGCGLTVTGEPVAYADLSAPERRAVDTILGELRRFDARARALTGRGIPRVLSRDAILVAFKGLVFFGNVGDHRVRISVWENLTGAQRGLVARWFGQPSEAAAAATYRRLFYRFLAVSQGVKEYMYELLTPGWLFAKRTLYSIEYDATRASLAFYAAVGEGAGMRAFLRRTCAPALRGLGPAYAGKFSKRYLAENVRALADPRDPSGYVYFLCRWIEMALGRPDTLLSELNWIRDLPKVEGP